MFLRLSACNGWLIAYGGGDDIHSPSSTAAVEVLCRMDGEWTALPAMPFARSAPIGFVFD
jgi:hypothetical protein